MEGKEPLGSDKTALVQSQDNVPSVGHTQAASSSAEKSSEVPETGVQDGASQNDSASGNLTPSGSGTQIVPDDSEESLNDLHLPPGNVLNIVHTLHQLRR